jgi:hypothetical protein
VSATRPVGPEPADATECEATGRARRTIVPREP